MNNVRRLVVGNLLRYMARGSRASKIKDLEKTSKSTATYAAD
jgi:hypothetical protein